MSASQYLLPTGYANTPVAAADGSLWVNHFSGLFRLYHGETTTILAYRDDEQGLTWMPSDPLNPYYSHHNAALPSPVSFGRLCLLLGLSAKDFPYSVFFFLWNHAVGSFCKWYLHQSDRYHGWHLCTVRQFPQANRKRHHRKLHYPFCIRRDHWSSGRGGQMLLRCSYRTASPFAASIWKPEIDSRLSAGYRHL